MSDTGPGVPAEGAGLREADYFAERRGRVDWAAFDRLMSRSGGEAPRPGDETDPGHEGDTDTRGGGT